MEEQAAMKEQAVVNNEIGDEIAVGKASLEYVGRWNRLVSTTNWEKGRIISEWRAALQAADAPAATFTDEAWSQRVGNVTPQHVGRLRRVYERFGETRAQYAGLFWSHFQAALDWTDAEMYLEGAVQNGWSVSQMRNQRWEALGGDPDLKPHDADVVASEWDEDVSAANDMPSATISESLGEVHETDEFGEGNSESVPFDADAPAASALESSAAMDAPSTPLLRPFEALPPLPTDLKEAFELMKLAILSHKITGWEEITRDDVLSVLESLRQLALAPAE
jgi:hypothetical protein